MKTIIITIAPYHPCPPQSVHPEDGSPCRTSFAVEESEKQSRLGSIKAVMVMIITIIIIMNIIMTTIVTIIMTTIIVITIITTPTCRQP